MLCRPTFNLHNFQNWKCRLFFCDLDNGTYSVYRETYAFGSVQYRISPCEGLDEMSLNIYDSVIEIAQICKSIMCCLDLCNFPFMLFERHSEQCSITLKSKR